METFPNKPRIYITGPMTGLPLFNFPAFDEAQKQLREMYPECYIISPANIDRNYYPCHDWESNTLPAGFKLCRMLLVDLEALSQCCVLYVLPGYERSKGSAVEIAFARALGMPLVFPGNDFQLAIVEHRGDSVIQYLSPEHCQLKLVKEALRGANKFNP